LYNSKHPKQPTILLATQWNIATPWIFEPQVKVLFLLLYQTDFFWKKQAIFDFVPLTALVITGEIIGNTTKDTLPWSNHQATPPRRGGGG